MSVQKPKNTGSYLSELGAVSQRETQTYYVDDKKRDK